MTGQQEKNSFERGQVVWLPNTDLGVGCIRASPRYLAKWKSSSLRKLES
jgi:hypothetical protein